MVSNRFCAKCGNNVANCSGGFCPHCGAKINLKKKSHKKVVIITAVSVLVALLVVAGVAIAISLTRGRTRTVMAYMIGSNLESGSSAASRDILEMVESNFDQEDVKVLVYTGGSKKWALDEINPNENAVFEIKDGNLVKVQTYDREIMTKPETLKQFINYAYENYKSDLYDLILWDHGGGPIFGYGSDEYSLSKSPMSLSELKEALEGTDLIQSDKKFELIGFDACLMGSLETASMLKNYSNYMIASEETEPGSGWNYLFLQNIDKEKNMKEIGQNVIDDYIVAYDDYEWDVDLSLSIIDLMKIDSVIVNAAKVFSRVSEEVTASTFSKYSRVLRSEKVYGYTGRDNSSYDLVDLADLVGTLVDYYPDEVNALTTAVNNAVVYSRSNMDHTNGLSFYFPTNNKKMIGELMDKYKDVAFASEYYDFLEKYTGFITGSKNVSKKNYDSLDVRVADEDGITIELTDELVDNYQSGEIIVYRKIDDNVFIPIYRSSEVELEEKNLHATTPNLQFVIEVTDSDGSTGYGWTALFEKERTDSYTDYVTYGVVGYETDDSSLGFEMKSQDTHIRLPANQDVAEVRDMRITADDTENGLANKWDVNSNIMFLEYVVAPLKLFDENGDRLDQPVSTGTLYGTSISIKDGDSYRFKIVDLDFDFGDMYDGYIPSDAIKDYYAEFIVHDTQGEAHRLNLIHIN